MSFDFVASHELRLRLVRILPHPLSNLLHQSKGLLTYSLVIVRFLDFLNSLSYGGRRCDSNVLRLRRKPRASASPRSNPTSSIVKLVAPKQRTALSNSPLLWWEEVDSNHRKLS